MMPTCWTAARPWWPKVCKSRRAAAITSRVRHRSLLPGSLRKPLLHTEGSDQAAAGGGAAKPAGPLPQVTVQVRLLDAKTGDPKTDTGAIDITKLAKPGNPVIPVAFRLKVDELAVGSYFAEIRAVDAPTASSPAKCRLRW